jgi:hypothetical protein
VYYELKQTQSAMGALSCTTELRAQARPCTHLRPPIPAAEPSATSAHLLPLLPANTASTASTASTADLFSITSNYAALYPSNL